MHSSSKKKLLMYLLWPLILTGCAVGGDDLGFELGDGVDNNVIVPSPPIDTPTGVSLAFPAATPGFAVNPQVLIEGVTVGHTASIYTNKACTSSIVGTAVVSVGNTVTVNISSDLSAAGTYRFFAKMSFGALLSRCTGDFNLSAKYVFDPSLGPAVTGIVDDLVPTNNKLWLWGCNKASCDFRFAVNASPTHSFTVDEPYGSFNTTSLGAGNGTFYIHVQPRDTSTSIEGFVQSYSVVMDNIAPTLPSASMASNNADADFAKIGDTLTLTFSSNETLGVLPVVNINGTGAAVNNLGSNNYSATYLYIGADADGLATFTIDFADVATNNGVQVTSTTNASSVTFDKITPTLNPVSIASNNANPAFAILGDIITLTFTSSESLGPLPTATINGNVRTVTDLGFNNYSVAHTVALADPLGVATFTVDFADQANNLGVQVTATTDVSSVTVDNSIPTLAPVTISSNNANLAFAKQGDIVTINFTGNEALQNVTAIIAGNAAIIGGGPTVWTATYTMGAGDPEVLIAFAVNFEDLAGNPGVQVTASTDASSVTYDRTAPTLSPVSLSSSNPSSTLAKVGDTLSLTFTSSESLGALPIVNLNGGPVLAIDLGSNNYLVLRVSLVGDAEVAATFTIDFTDPANNAGIQVTATTDASSITLDKSAPTLNPVTIASNNADPTLATIGNDVTVSFTANEPASLPIVTIAGSAAIVTPGGGNSFTATRTFSGVDPPGLVAFTIDFDDLAGNTGLQVTNVTDISFVTFNPNATQLAFVVQPTSTAAGDNITPAITVVLRDASNNLVTTETSNVTLAINANPGSSTLSGTLTVAAVAGTATFSDINLDNGGVGYTLDATAGGLTTAASNTFDIVTLPTVTITSFPDISSANENTYVTSGACSEEGRAVTILVGAATATPTCSGGAWTTGTMDVSGEAEGSVTITADHDDALTNDAIQATQNVTKDTITQTVFITSAPSITTLNETNYLVSGTCTNSGVLVDVFVGTVNSQPNCSGGTFATGSMNVSGEADVLLIIVRQLKTR
jgi:hypothetical protein